MNPILQKLTNMPNSSQNNIIEQMLNNPQFKQFYEDNKNKTPQQICEEYGLDYNMVKMLASKR